LFLTTGKT